MQCRYRLPPPIVGQNTSSSNNKPKYNLEINNTSPPIGNCTLIDPLVTGVVMKNWPTDRASWAPHGEPSWYIGPAMDHYRFHKAYILKTRA